MRPCSVTRSNVIWLASYPKSGNTWFRILLANLKSGRDQPVDIRSRIGTGGDMVSRRRFDDITMIESGLLTGDEVDSLRPAVCESLAAEAAPNSWIKVHDAWRRTPAGEVLFGRNAGRAAIYVVRDPRDVAVSLAHIKNKTMDSAVEFMNSTAAMLSSPVGRQLAWLPEKLGDWSGHVISWLDQRDVPVHVVPYEALKRDTVGVLENALRFAGEAVVRADVERAVRHSEFGALRRQESAAGFREPGLPFFRRGEVGSWRDELTPAQAARIVDAHGAVMRRVGYLP
jgi:aryl sulfotransferase